MAIGRGGGGPALSVPEGVEVRGEIREGFDSVLTVEALDLLAQLHRRFNPRRLELLDARHRRQVELDAGGSLDFLPETARNDPSWTVAEPAPGRIDRHGGYELGRSLFTEMALSETLSEFVTLPAYTRMP